MTNRWIEYVKKFAKDNDLSYGCALSDPNLRRGYVPTGKKAKAKRDDEEREKRQDVEEARLKAIADEEFKKKAQGYYTQESTKQDIEGAIWRANKRMEEGAWLTKSIGKKPFFRERYKQEVENRKEEKKLIILLEKRLREM
jgi:hypothetical protein